MKVSNPYPIQIAPIDMRGRRAAFSLMELLVVIAVIAILAAILLPVISTIRRHGESSKCVSNFKQIGQAIMLHVADNEGRLPGPIYREQAVVYQWTSQAIVHQGHLISHLAPYMDGELETGRSGRANLPAFLCPAWVSSMGFEPGELITRGVPFQAERRFFGVYNRDPDLTADAVRMSGIDPALMKIAALWETDQMDGTAYGNTKNDRLATEPVHGNVRHYLYLDGSVSAVSLEDQERIQEIQNKTY